MNSAEGVYITIVSTNFCLNARNVEGHALWTRPSLIFVGKMCVNRTFSLAEFIYFYESYHVIGGVSGLSPREVQAFKLRLRRRAKRLG